MNKHQKVVFISMSLTFLYVMGLTMYEIGLLQTPTIGLFLLAVIIFGCCILCFYIWVLKNKALIDKICKHQL